MRALIRLFRLKPGPLVGVAGFTVLSLLLTGLVAGTLMKGGGVRPQTYTAVFRDASGLMVGDDVRMAGVRVGRVESRERRGNLAYVEFTVSGDQVVHAGSQANIEMLNLLGQHFIDVTRGATGSPQLAPGSTIGLDRTKGPLDLTALFNAFKPLFDLLQPADVNRLSTEIVAVLQGQGPTLTDLMRQTASLTSYLGQRDQVIDQVIANMSLVLQNTAEHRDDLTQLISRLGDLTHGVVQDRTQITTALDSLSHLSVAMADLARRTRVPMTRDIAGISALAALVNGRTAALVRGLQATPRLLDAYARAMSYGSWLNVYICSMSLGLVGGPVVDGHPGGHSKGCR